MKINKLFWIFGLVFVLSSASVFAFTLSDIYRNSWFILFVNSSIIWIVLFTLQVFLMPQKAGKEKAVIWIASSVAAVLIAWNFGGGGKNYIWQAGTLSTLFNIKILVNTILVAGVAYFAAGFLGIDPKNKPQQIGIAILALFIGLVVATNIGPNEWLWDTSNVKGLYDYLLGKDGILRYEKPHYRLFIFGISALLFGWFFTSYLMPQGNQKLSWVISIIVSANLASRGAPTDTIIVLGEVFALLIIGKQITQGAGSVGTFIGWIIAITITQFIFCTVFGKSGVVLLLEATLGQIKIPYIGWSPFGWLIAWAKIPCSVIASKLGVATGVTPLPPVLPPGITPPPGIIPPTSGWSIGGIMIGVAKAIAAGAAGLWALIKWW